MNDLALGSSSYTVLLVNIPAMSANLLAAALAEQGTASIVGTAQSAGSTELLLTTHMPRIAIVGSRSGREQPTGLAFVEQIASTAPRTRQIVLGHDLGEEDEITPAARGRARFAVRGRSYVATALPLHFLCSRGSGLGQQSAGRAPARFSLAASCATRHQCVGRPHP